MRFVSRTAFFFLSFQRSIDNEEVVGRDRRYRLSRPLDSAIFLREISSVTMGVFGMFTLMNIYITPITLEVVAPSLREFYSNLTKFRNDFFVPTKLTINHTSPKILLSNQESLLFTSRQVRYALDDRWQLSNLSHNLTYKMTSKVWSRIFIYFACSIFNIFATLCK